MHNQLLIDLTTSNHHPHQRVWIFPNWQMSQNGADYNQTLIYVLQRP